MENIKNILRDIEQEQKISILYACETGSRAWGFPSPDSDYDVRFIYMNDKDWYLSLEERKDTIQRAITDDFDITGWDLKKTLQLLKKSNAPLIERFQSHIEYFSVPGFKNEFNNLVKNYYSPIAVFYHHHSLAVKFWGNIRGKEKVKLKNYFYLIRSLLSCNWIIEDNAVLPMHMEGLMILIEEEHKNKLRELIKLKATVGEKYLYTVDKFLNDWIFHLWELIENSKTNLKINCSDYSLLNEFFVKTINEKPHD